MLAMRIDVELSSERRLFNEERFFNTSVMHAVTRHPKTCQHNRKIPYSTLRQDAREGAKRISNTSVRRYSHKLIHRARRRESTHKPCSQ